MNRLLLYAMFIVMLGMLATAWFDHQDFETTVLHNLQIQEFQDASGIRKNLDDALIRTKQYGRVLAVAPSFTHAVTPTLPVHKRDLAKSELAYMLRDLLQISDSAIHMALISPQAEVITATNEGRYAELNPKCKEEIIKQALQGQTVSRICPIDRQAPSYIVAEPVRINGVINGILIMQLELAPIIADWSEFLPQISGSFAAIVDETGNVIGSTPDAVLADGKTLQASYFAAISNAQSGIMELEINGSTWQTAYSTSQHMGWKVITAVPKQEILAPAKGTLIRSLTTHIFGALISIGILLALIAMMTKNMRSRLSSIMSEVGEAIPKHSGFFEEINILLNYLHNSISTMRDNMAYTETARQDLARRKAKLEEEVKLRTDELNKERIVFKAVLDHSPIGIAVSVDNIIKLATPSLHKMLNIDEGDDLTKAYVEKEQWERNADAIKREGCITSVAQRMSGPDGSQRDVLYTGIKTEFQGQEAIINWHVDITGVLAAEKELLQARDAAEKSARAKKDFLDRMSHELRTPMNAIIGMCYLCMHTDLDPRQHEYLSKIQAAAGNLLALINDVLDFSKIESGRMILEKAPFKIQEITNNTYDLLQLKAVNKGLAFNIRLAENLPEIILGDPLRLSQILTNLTSNAIKFTKSGQVDLRVENKGCQGNSCLLRFTVSDTGIGITPEHMGKIFEAFHQADGFITRKYEGSGLGLAITKNLVDLMGGTIWVESEPGQGCKFYFEIEFETLEETPGQVPATDMIGRLAGIQGANILVVEDNETNQIIACEILERLGMQVEVAANGQEALDTLLKKDFALVLMDIQMPIMDGLTAAKKIRSSDLPGAVELPIVAMTAHVQVYDREQSILAGMNEHLTKPVNPDELSSVLATWIKPGKKPLATHDVRHGKAVEVEQSKTNDGVNMYVPGVDTKTGLARVMGNEKLYKNLLQRLATKYDDTTDKIKEALAKEDMETAVRLAHTLKGVAAGLGADSLALASSELEQALKNNGAVQTLLRNFGDELIKIVQSIKNSIDAEDAPPAPAVTGPSLTAADLTAIRNFMEKLPELAETDFIAAQNGLNSFATKLESSIASAEFRALREALEDFELEAIYAKSQDLLQKLVK